MVSTQREPLACQPGRRGGRGQRKGSRQRLPQCDLRNVISNPATYDVDICVSFQHIKLEVIFIHDLATIAYMRLIFETSKKLDTFVKVGNRTFKRCSIQRIFASLLWEGGPVLSVEKRPQVSCGSLASLNFHRYRIRTTGVSLLECQRNLWPQAYDRGISCSNVEPLSLWTFHLDPLELRLWFSFSFLYQINSVLYSGGS